MRIYQSDYMHWAKTLQAARFNLANSGLAACPLQLLDLKLEDLELSGASFYGWPPLQAALARHLRVPEHSVVQATGTSGANHLAMAALLNPGDEVLVESPTYELLWTTAGYFGVHLRRLSRRLENRFALDLDELKRQLRPNTQLVVVTNLHNPSSAEIPNATLREAAALMAAQGGHLLVDEVYLDAANDCAPRTSFGVAENILVTSSLTKVYGLSGLRCGWILAQPKLAERLWRLNDLFGVIPAHAAERLSVKVFEQFDRVALRARTILGANRTLLNAFLSERDDLEGWPLTSGTVSFPRLRSGRVDELCRILRQQYETTVAPGHFFDLPEHFRIGIGRETAETAEGLHRLGRALDQLRA